MKKVIFVSLLAFGYCFNQLQAQVKIGNNPTVINRGAILELESTSGKQALLLSRTADLTSILTPAKGMIAYYTGNSTTTTGNAQYTGEGFYMFMDVAGTSTWVKLGNASEVLDKWTKGGDNITDPAKAKLGTINAQAISLITGNGERIRISEDNALTEVKTLLTRLENDVVIGDAAATAANSTLDIRGSVSNQYTTVTANTTLDKTHYMVHCDLAGIAANGTLQITLPAASSTKGRIYVIKKLNGDIDKEVSVATGSGDTFDGAITSTPLYNDGTTIVVQSDGASKWVILSRTVN